MEQIVGFVLLTISPEKEIEVFEKLKSLEEVMEVHPIFGEYDFLVKVKSESPKSLGEYVMEVIREIDGILDSKTFVTANI